MALYSIYLNYVNEVHKGSYMPLLTGNQADRVKETLFKSYDSCVNCQPFEDGEAVWMTEHEDLETALREAIYVCGVDDEVGEEVIDQNVPVIIEILELTCPNCGTSWDDPTFEIGSA
jgi:ribosomal protein S27AE